jgi:hypothetical protein
VKCMRVTERAEARGEPHTACPNDGVDETLVQINQLPYLMVLCSFHLAEFDRKAADARQRRKAANDKARAKAESRVRA